MGKYDEDLMIKTFTATTSEEIDKKCNEFAKNNKIKATQTNVFFCEETKKTNYVYTLFYLPKINAKEIMKKSTQEKKILTNQPKIIYSESEAKWTNCLKCNARWKWTHYKMCPNKHSFEGLPKDLHEEYSKIWLKHGVKMENGKDGNEENNQMDKRI